jgi:hypothetical protein
MDTRLPHDSEWVRALSARLRSGSPHLFAPNAPEAIPRLVPNPTSQPAREQPPAEPGLSSVLQQIDRERAARAEEERRAADPVEQQRARLDELAPQMTSEEVFAVQECLTLARTDEQLGAAYLSGVVAYLDGVEHQDEF